MLDLNQGGSSQDGKVYLQESYWWAYMHPKRMRVFDRQWLVNLILWGSFGQDKGPAVRAIQIPASATSAIRTSKPLRQMTAGGARAHLAAAAAGEEFAPDRSSKLEGAEQHQHLVGQKRALSSASVGHGERLGLSRLWNM